MEDQALYPDPATYRDSHPEPDPLMQCIMIRADSRVAVEWIHGAIEHGLHQMEEVMNDRRLDLSFPQPPTPEYESASKQMYGILYALETLLGQMEK